MIGFDCMTVACAAIAQDRTDPGSQMTAVLNKLRISELSVYDCSKIIGESFRMRVPKTRVCS